MCLVVFFFKQKTAYELRISDWSSDVCSSDLATGITSGSRHVLGRLLAKGDLQLGQHDVLVVEANKIHAKQIIRLLEAAAPTGARVVLAGDGKGSTGPDRKSVVLGKSVSVV